MHQNSAGQLSGSLSSTAPEIALEKDRAYKWLLQLTIVAALFIFLWGIRSMPFLSHNEARRAIVAREMLASGDWLIPTLNGKEYIAKPPLLYWAIACIGLIFGSVSEWTARLPSSLCALGLIWITFKKVKEQFGKWPALFSSMALTTSPLFTLMGRRAEIEMLLTFCCTLAMLYFMEYLYSSVGRKQLYLSYLFLGLAFLTKGPVVLLFYAPPLLCYYAISKDRRALEGLSFGRGWILFALTALPWFIYVFAQAEGQMVKDLIHRDIVGKTLTDARSPWYGYFATIGAGFPPWSLLLLCKSKEQTAALWRQRDASFIICWIAAPFFIMSCFATKHGKYLLPLFPAVAAFLGIWAARLYATAADRWGSKSGSLPLTVAAAVYGGWMLYYSVIEPRVQNYRYDAVSPLVQQIDALRSKAPVYSYVGIDPRIVYYDRQTIPIVNDRSVESMVEQDAPFVMIVEDRYFEKLERKPDLCLLGDFRPIFNRKGAVRLYGSGAVCR